jgi:uncharacterized membrane protein YcaP (DUF421 family)
MQRSSIKIRPVRSNNSFTPDAMESVFRALIVYFALLIIFRVSGKRTIQQSTPFGLILIFLISSSVTDALKDDDKSLTNGFLIVMTLVVTHVLVSYLKRDSQTVSKIINDVPTLLVKNGKLLKERTKRARVTEGEIIAAARLEKVPGMQGIKYAILEVDGSICIIPQRIHQLEMEELSETNK